MNIGSVFDGSPLIVICKALDILCIFINHFRAET